MSPSQTLRRLLRSLALLMPLTVFLPQPAAALPSFARQTGMECAACHVGAFGPQLTPTGIRFKLGGYSDGEGGNLPLSAMAVGSFTHTKEDQDPAPEHLKKNDNLTLDEVSAFLGGRFSEHSGALVQVTHSGIDHSTALDQMDVRVTRNIKLGGKDGIVGLTLNNNPGVQDPFNTLPAWRFPFTSSEAALGTGEAASLLNGGLEGRVLGLSAYAFLQDHLYGEIGAYRSMSPSLQKRIGLDEDEQKINGNTYWRVGWMGDRKRDSFHVGAFGWSASLTPDRGVPSERERYRDIGLDAGYQYLGNRNRVFAIDGSVTRERLRTPGTNDSETLRETRLNASYYIDQTWGLSAGVFSTTGSDAALDTRGSLLQVDWTPWGKENIAIAQPFPAANLRLGAQYWRYGRVDGESAGSHNANTLFVFAWLSF